MGYPMFPSMDEWVKKIYLTHTTEHYSAMKKERGMIYQKEIKVETTMLSEISQA